MSKDFFEVIEGYTGEIRSMIYKGESIGSIVKKATSLAKFLGENDFLYDRIISEAYKSWWKSSKEIFSVEVVEELGCKRSLQDLKMGVHHGRFISYLKRERCFLRGGNVNNVLAEAALFGKNSGKSSSEEDLVEFVKIKIIASYEEVIGLYKRALSKCYHMEDKKWVNSAPN